MCSVSGRDVRAVVSDAGPVLEGGGEHGRWEEGNVGEVVVCYCGLYGVAVGCGVPVLDG